MRFVHLNRATLCDNCHCYATRRLEGMTRLARLNLCGYCINRLRHAIDELTVDDPDYEKPDPRQKGYRPMVIDG